MTVGEPVVVGESVDAGESRNLLKQTKIIKYNDQRATCREKKIRKNRKKITRWCQ